MFYDNYMGGSISRFILFQASVADAFMIVGLSLLFLRLKYFERREWLIIVFGVVFAVFIERFALSIGWWQYNTNMVIIPFIKTGLTPTIQLGILGYLSLGLSDWILRSEITK